LFAPKHYYSGGSAEEWRVARKQALDEVERWQTDVWGPYDVLGSDRERLGYYRDRPSETGGGLGVMVLVGMFAGLRFGEAAALRVSSVKLGAEPRVTVLEAATEVRGVVAVGPPKTAGSLRTIPISRALADILHEHIQRDRSPDRFLFTTPTGKVLSRTRFAARIWNPAVRLADIAPHPTFHDLRHSYAAWLIANHVHPKVIQERLGHSSIRTTLDVYGHLMRTLEADQESWMDAALG
jgi:integrase